MADQLSNDLASLRIQREENPAAKASRRGWLVALLLLVPVGIVGFFVANALAARVFKTEVGVTEIRLVSPAQASTLVTSTGYVLPQTTSRVGARVLGRVAEVLVKEGATVAAGDVLVRLDDTEQRTAIAGARARLAAAKARRQAAMASVAEARVQLRREQELAARGVGTAAAVEDLASRAQVLEETARAADADADAAQAELGQLELTREYLTVIAPIGGVLLTRPAEVGELVGPGTAPVVEIADFSTLVVETDVPEARLALIQPDGPAEIVLDAFPTVRHRGRVASVSPRVNRAKATVVVKVRFADPVQGVLPDMSARVGFLSGELAADAVREPPRLFVPGSAVVERDGQRVVFRLDDGKAVRESVTLGPPMSGGFELIAGPADGTRVIASPPDGLDDGYPIQERTD